VASQLSGGWWHNYSTKTRQASCAQPKLILTVVYMRIYAVHKASFAKKVNGWYKKVLIEIVLAKNVALVGKLAMM
jgi:hypothetical protein